MQTHKRAKRQTTRSRSGMEASSPLGDMFAEIGWFLYLAAAVVVFIGFAYLFSMLS